MRRSLSQRVRGHTGKSGSIASVVVTGMRVVQDGNERYVSDVDRVDGSKEGRGQRWKRPSVQASKRRSECQASGVRAVGHR